MGYHTESHIRVGWFNDCPVDRRFMWGALYSWRNFAWEVIYGQGCACWIWNWTEGSGWHSERSSSGCRHLMSHLLIKVLSSGAHTTVPESCVLHFLLTHLVDLLLLLSSQRGAFFVCRVMLSSWLYPSFCLVHSVLVSSPALLSQSFTQLNLCVHSLSPASFPPPQSQWNKSTCSLSSITLWEDDCFCSAFEMTVVIYANGVFS